MTKSSNDKTKHRCENGNAKKTNQVDEPIIIQERETFIETITFNKRLINVLFDEGANECLIRKDLVPDTWEIKPSPKATTKLFNGSEVDLLGYVTFIQNKVQFPCYVVAELPYPMIIGPNEVNYNGLRHLIGRVEVSGIGPVNALIDSGCSTCFVDEDILPDSIKSKIKSCPAKANTFDGSTKDILGYVYLSVNYLGKTVELPFDVFAKSCDDCPSDCPECARSSSWILGTTWIRRSGAILQSDGVKLGVTFSGEKENDDCMADWCPIPYVSVDVDGIRKVKALVDTGAPECYIRRDLLTKLKKSKAISSSRCKQECVSLSITFQGITTFIENVNVESKLGKEFILGMDWIHQTRAVIRSDGSKIIVFQPGLAPKPKWSNRLIAYLSKQWNLTIGSVSRISSLVSNLM